VPRRADQVERADLPVVELDAGETTGQIFALASPAADLSFVSLEGVSYEPEAVACAPAAISPSSPPSAARDPRAAGRA
jgi:hypothetical protein